MPRGGTTKCPEPWHDERCTGCTASHEQAALLCWDCQFLEVDDHEFTDANDSPAIECAKGYFDKEALNERAGLKRCITKAADCPDFEEDSGESSVTRGGVEPDPHASPLWLSKRPVRVYGKDLDRADKEGEGAAQ